MSERRSPPGADDARGAAAARDAGIEGLRGLAIVLLVAAHAYPWELAPRTGLARIHEALGLVRMPLFAAISGWTYAGREPRVGERGAFLRGRARRLLLPVASLGTIALFVRDHPLRFAWPVSAWSAARELAQPRGQLWFVESLFVIALVLVALSATGALTTLGRWRASTVVFLLLPLAMPGIDRWPWRSHEWGGGVVLLLGFTLLGIGAGRWEGLLGDHRWTRLAVGSLAAGVLAQVLAQRGLLDLSVERGGVISLLVGVPAILLLLRFRASLGGIAWLGAPSYAIYLYHMDALEWTRRTMVAGGLGAPSAMSYFALVVAGVMVPVGLHRLFIRSRWTRRLLLGMR